MLARSLRMARFVRSVGGAGQETGFLILQSVVRAGIFFSHITLFYTNPPARPGCWCTGPSLAPPRQHARNGPSNDRANASLAPSRLA